MDLSINSDENEELLEELDDDGIDLDEIVQVEDNTVYPCMIIEGVNTALEVEYFRNKIQSDEISLPLYYVSEDETVPVYVSKIELTLQNLLTIRDIYDYKIKIFKAKDVSVDIDLDNPESLTKFIKI